MRRDRWYAYQGLRILVKPGVFHPGLFHSTKLLIRYLATADLKGKSVLEPGCGSGLISIYAARRGADVTALDINKMAIETTRMNAAMNQVDIRVVESDLMTALAPSSFDYIMINPPYYPRDPVNDAQKAWYCGSHFSYFHDLFRQLPAYCDGNSQVIMVLSEDCDLDSIRNIARTYGQEMQLAAAKRNAFESNYLFRIRLV